MKRKILLQLDCDSIASSFDAVVAIDAGVDFLLQYANVDEKNVVGLIHGAMFTRGPEDLSSTAVFIGGSSIVCSEAIAAAITKAMFDPFKLSVVIDPNGSNSTASAAVLCAMKHIDLRGKKAVVMGATGAVGQRVCQLLLAQSSIVHLGSRDLAKATQLADQLCQQQQLDQAFAFDYSETMTNDAILDADVIISCGAAGSQLLTSHQLGFATAAKVAIDLNAVPPAGIAGIAVTDKAIQRGNRFDYGALGVGGLKMKLHKASIRQAFEKRGQLIGPLEMLELGKRI